MQYTASIVAVRGDGVTVRLDPNPDGLHNIEFDIEFPDDESLVTRAWLRDQVKDFAYHQARPVWRREYRRLQRRADTSRRDRIDEVLRDLTYTGNDTEEPDGTGV